MEQEFVDEQAYRRGVPALWNEVRDGIGLALIEFNARLFGLQEATAKDCTSKGQWCLRVLKSVDGSTIEVFIDEAERAVKSAAPLGEPSTVCRYRLKQDRSGLELFTESLDAQRVLSADDACRAALHDFLLKPFPKMFVDSGKIAIL